MKQSEALCRILYKMLDIDENIVPIKVDSGNKQVGYYKEYELNERYVLIRTSKEFKVKDMLEISNSCYLAYYDKIYGINSFVSKEDFESSKFFEKKYYRESIYFSHFLTKFLLEMMSNYTKSHKYDDAIKFFSKPIKIGKLTELSEEDRSIQESLNESYIIMKSYCDNMFDKYFDDFEKWIVMY